MFESVLKTPLSVFFSNLLKKILGPLSANPTKWSNTQTIRHVLDVWHNLE